MDLDSSHPGSDSDLPIKPSPSDDESLFHDPAIPTRRHSFSSAGSEYSPDPSDSDHEPVTTTATTTTKRRPRSPSEDDRLSDPFGSPRKRRSTSPGLFDYEEEERGRSRKRRKSESPVQRSRAVFNHEYLSLLNEDIRDVTFQFLAEDGGPDLAPSQVGMMWWTAEEKAVLFEALGRLGSDRKVEIADRIKTKGELEVAMYLEVLERNARERKQRRELQHVVLADVPAAVELSQACCAALEEAADGVVVRQEMWEQRREEKKWGRVRWLITQGNIRGVEKEEARDMEAVRLFRVKQWLKLSEKVFMNAAFDEYNWRSVSDDKPSIRASALEEFHSLAVSLTTRLVSAVIYICEAGARAREESDEGIEVEVRRKDVEAAVASLGLPESGEKFWAGCPRRLRLNIIDDEESDKPLPAGEEDLEPMSYSDVEEALGMEGRGLGARVDADSSDESDLVSLSDTPSVDGDNVKGETIDSGEEDAEEVEEEGEEKEEEGDKPMPRVNEEEVQREANELLKFSALDYPNTTRAKRKLKARIRIAHAREAHANALDSQASFNEEKQMWSMLGKAPSVPLVKREKPEVQPSSYSHPVDDMIYTRTVGGGGWRDNLGYVPSKWELEARVMLTEGEGEARSKAGH